MSNTYNGWTNYATWRVNLTNPRSGFPSIPRKPLLPLFKRLELLCPVTATDHLTKLWKSAGGLVWAF